MEWIKTDDFQYCRKIAEDKYELIQAVYIEADDDLCWGICEPKEIDLNEWVRDGKYTEDCKLIITAFYGTVERFEDSYVDNETRKQILAEMIYEETYRYMCARYGRVTEDQAEKILEYYVETGEYLEIGE